MEKPYPTRRSSLLRIAGIATTGLLLPHMAFAGRAHLTQSANDRLRVEPLGTSDAALMPFEIAVGAGAKSNRQLVLIPARQYLAIVALLEKSVPAGKSERIFQISRTRAPQPSTTYLAGAPQMRDVIHLIEQGLNAAKAPPLPWLEAIKGGL